METSLRGVRLWALKKCQLPIHRVLTPTAPLMKTSTSLLRLKWYVHQHWIMLSMKKVIILMSRLTSGNNASDLAMLIEDFKMRIYNQKEKYLELKKKEEKLEKED